MLKTKQPRNRVRLRGCTVKWVKGISRHKSFSTYRNCQTLAETSSAQ
jgi:hypothetical protein